ncbi:hypothetical protein Pmani_000973 [Petrolisthes manimaculis]|uniref:Uncharacterized protein n=1 Tax=Petrolisthes manimaculis TaxID=1843537 RepID=A0AAE1QKW6_9EUCA|nr:hypothetical protein Pmani_000973 [Petrolisthes manimaculis]
MESNGRTTEVWKVTGKQQRSGRQRKNNRGLEGNGKTTEVWKATGEQQRSGRQWENNKDLEGNGRTTEVWKATGEQQRSGRQRENNRDGNLGMPLTRIIQDNVTAAGQLTLHNRDDNYVHLRHTTIDAAPVRPSTVDESLEDLTGRVLGAVCGRAVHTFHSLQFPDPHLASVTPPYNTQHSLQSCFAPLQELHKAIREAENSA